MPGEIALPNGRALGVIALLLTFVAGCEHETPLEAPPLMAASTSPMAFGPDGPVKVYTGEEIIAWAEGKLELLSNAKPDPVPERRARAVRRLQEIIRQTREPYGAASISLSPAGAAANGPVVVADPGNQLLSESQLNITSANTNVMFNPGGSEASTASMYLSTTTDVPATISHYAYLYVDFGVHDGFLSNQTTSPTTVLGSITEFPQLYPCYSELQEAQAHGPHTAQDANVVVQVISAGYAVCGPGGGGGGGGGPGGGGGGGGGDDYSWLCAEYEVEPGTYQVYVDGEYYGTIEC